MTGAGVDVTVASVAERDGRFLIVEERVSDGIVFNQPAGHLEPGESLLEAVVRETLEETGHAFEPEYLIGIYSWRCDDQLSFLRVCFAGKAQPPDSPSTLDEGIIASHWLTRDELLSPQRKLRSPLVLRAIDDYLAKARYPLDCVHHVASESARQRA